MSDANPVRDEAVVRAHAWAVRLWNERKISADFTSDDEAELVEMLLGFLAVAPYPEPAEYVARIADLRQQLETVKQENCDLLIGHAELTRRLALAQSIITSLGNPNVQKYPPSQETVIPPDVSGSAP